MSTVKDHITERIESAKKAYLGDLNAMSEEDLTVSAGGASRTPADFTYEIVFINDRVSKRLKGEDPGEFKFEGWMKAPEEFNNKASIIEKFTSSLDEVISEFSKVPEDEMFRVIDTGNGETSPMDLVGFTATHITYHDAQLNFIQSLKGDSEMHWD